MSKSGDKKVKGQHSSDPFSNIFLMINQGHMSQRDLQLIQNQYLLGGYLF